jgi:hypothetical protein
MTNMATSNVTARTADSIETSFLFTLRPEWLASSAGDEQAIGTANERSVTGMF